jgi:hypothetical protein
MIDKSSKIALKQLIEEAIHEEFSSRLLIESVPGKFWFAIVDSISAADLKRKTIRDIDDFVNKHKFYRNAISTDITYELVPYKELAYFTDKKQYLRTAKQMAHAITARMNTKAVYILRVEEDDKGNPIQAKYLEQIP